jgi:hypothetical protein
MGLILWRLAPLVVGTGQASEVPTARDAMSPAEGRREMDIAALANEAVE